MFSWRLLSLHPRHCTGQDKTKDKLINNRHEQVKFWTSGAVHHSTCVIYWHSSAVPRYDTCVWLEMCFLERLCFFKLCWPRFCPQEPWTTWRRRSPTLPATTWVQPCSVCWFAWCSLKLKSACLRRLLCQAFKTSSNPWWKWPRRRPRWINGAEDPPWSQLTNRVFWTEPFSGILLAFRRLKTKITPPQFNFLLCWVLQMSL